DTSPPLTPLQKLVSIMPVHEPNVLALAQELAKHYGSITADVLQAVIPRRMARVEREIAQQRDDGRIPKPPVIEPPGDVALTESSGPEFRWDLIDGADQLFSPGHAEHYALSLPSAFGSWDSMGVLADAAQRLAAAGQISQIGRAHV